MGNRPGFTKYRRPRQPSSILDCSACAAACEKDTPLHGKQAGTDQSGAQQMTYFVDHPAARHVARGKSPRRRPPGPGSLS